MIDPAIEAELQELAPFRRIASPRAAWRHAIARVDRRAADLREAEVEVRAGNLHDADYFRQLLREAVRLANGLAYLAGIAGPYARRT